jgi:hypothetical protein
MKNLFIFAPMLLYQRKMASKVKIYLDTSVISCLQVPETPERMADTLRLWEDIQANVYEVVISDITIAEINDCPEPKRSFMLNALKKIPLIVIEAEKKSRRTFARVHTIGYFKREKYRRLYAYCNCVVGKMRCNRFVELQTHCERQNDRRSKNNFKNQRI